jgi:glucokinase
MKSGYRLGIDLGGTLVKLALVGPAGRVVSLKEVETVLNPRDLISRLKRAAEPWRLKGLRGTGVGVAGDVDPVKGAVRFAPNLKWKNVPIRSLLRKAGFPAPVHVENDATAAAWGAYHGELKKRTENLIVLTLGTGVGGGLVLDRRLYRGSTGTAGELGHITVDPGGPLCGCGNRGCLEAYLGGIHLVRWAKAEMLRRKRKAPADLTPFSLFQAARRGDPAARALWNRAGWALGIGLASLINIFNPDTILLTGGVAGAHPLFLPAARREIAKRAFLTPRRAVFLRVFPQSKNLGVIGAALLIP